MLRPLSAALMLSCACLAPAASAQPADPEVTRPKFASRVVAAFDFEEPDNPLPVPAQWVRGQNDPGVPRLRPGFPLWNLASLDTTRARSGLYSVHLPTRGGSTSLVMRQGALPVLPGADFRVAAWVRTEGLLHARAGIEVTLLDELGAPVPGQVFRSRVIRAESGWELLEVEVANTSAAFLQIDLLLLQPDQHRKAPPRFDELVTLEDVSGGAWFDDVTVAQSPQIDISLKQPGNIIPDTSKPGITVHARDMTGEALAVSLRIFDIDGRQVDAADFAFQGGRMSREWQPAITQLGWYRALVEISDGVRTVGADTLDFVWVPAQARSSGLPDPSIAGGSADRARFGVIVEQHHPALLAVLPEATAHMGVGSVSIPAWWDGQLPGGPEAVELLLPVILAMRDNWQEVTLVLDRLPTEMADQFALSVEDVLAILETPDEFWGPALLPLMDRLGQVVQRWQAGRADSERLFTDPKAAERVARFQTELRRLVPEAVLAMPWPVDIAPGDILSGPDRSLVLSVPALAPPDAIVSAGPMWADGSAAGRPVQVALRCQDASEIGYRYAAEDFARRAIEAWVAFGPRHGTTDAGGSIAVIDPWVWSHRGGGELQARPEAAVMRTLAGALADRAGSTDVVLAPGVRAVLLEPRAPAPGGTTAALAVWAAPGTVAPPHIDMLLGRDPVRVLDIFGNERPLKPTESENGGIPFHRVPVGSAPIIIEGVDAKLIRFVTTLQLDPPVLEAQSAEHHHDLILTNPWPIPVRGEIYIVEPGGFSDARGEIDRNWRIAPRVIGFMLEGGGTARFPVEFIFSPFEESGPKELLLDVDLNADEAYGLMRVRRSVHLGSELMRLDVSYRLGPDSGGPNVYIDADLINTGPDAMTSRISVFAPGFPRESASVTALAPGQAARRTFILPGGATTLAGGLASVSVEVPDLRLRLNRSVRID